MATPKINENCYYVQNDPHRCKIKLEKFHLVLLGSYYGSFSGGRNPPPPPGEIGLRSLLFVLFGQSQASIILKSVGN